MRRVALPGLAFLAVALKPAPVAAPPHPFMLECAQFCSPEVPTGIYDVDWALVCECADTRVLKKVL